MDASLDLNSLVKYPQVEPISPSSHKAREMTSPSVDATAQKAHIAGLATLQILGLFVFGTIAGMIIGATCAKLETCVALPGKTELSVTGHMLLPIIACIAFGIFVGAYLVYKAASNPKKYLEDLVDEQINKKALEIEKEKSPFKKDRLQQELEKLYASRQDVTREPFEIDSRIYDWAATKIAATLIR